MNLDSQAASASLRRAAWTAGLSLLVMAVLSPAAFFGIFPRLIDRADMALTLRNLAEHRALFLTGLLCYLVTFVADVVCAWALYVLLRPAGAGLALLAGAFRFLYATLAVVALQKYATLLRLTDSDYGATFGPPQLQAQVRALVDSFRSEWGFSMVFFALHLLLLGWVVARARYIPRVFGPLLAINGLGYLVDALRPYLFPGLALRWLPVLFFGELIFMLWLLVRGHRIVAPRPVEPAGVALSELPPRPPA